VAVAAARVPGGAATLVRPTGYVVVADGTRFHRRDCALVGVKATVPHRRGDGRTSCEVCLP
jgi:hypothetical protein